MKKIIIFVETIFSFFSIIKTSMIPETDKLNHTKKQMLAMIDVAMGGRAAEDVFIGND